MSETRSQPSRARNRIAAATVAGLTLLAFAPSLANGFVNWDDNLLLLDNTAWRGLTWTNLRWMFTTFHGEQYHPLTWLSLALDHKIWGMNPFGYHLTHLLLHAANAFLFYFLATRLLALAWRERGRTFRQTVGATAAALIFALHPLRAETVSWITERRGLLCGLFYIGALLAYLRARESQVAPRTSQRGLIPALALAACALLSKPMAASLPFVMLALDYYPLRRVGGTAKWTATGQIIIEKIPLLLMTLGAIILLRLGYAGETGGNVPLDRVAASAYGAAFYPLKTLLPFGLTHIYQYYPRIDPLQTQYLFSGIAAMTLTIWLFARALRQKDEKQPTAWTAWLAYGLIIAPVVGIVEIGSHLAADRHSYIACLPLAMLGGGLIGSLLVKSAEARSNRAWAILGATALLLTSWGALAVRQQQFWRNGLRLWANAAKLDPDSPRAWLGNGDALVLADAAEAGREDLQRAVDIFPDAAGWRALGLARFSLGDYDGAIAAQNQAIERDNTMLDAWLARGRARQRLHDLAGARSDFDQAIKLDAGSALPYAYRGNVRLQQGDRDGAIADLRLALERDETIKGAWRYLGMALALRGQARAEGAPAAAEWAADFREAVAAYDAALRREPDDAEALRYRAVAWAWLGEAQKAEADCRTLEKLTGKSQEELRALTRKISATRSAR